MYPTYWHPQVASRWTWVENTSHLKFPKVVRRRNLWKRRKIETHLQRRASNVPRQKAALSLRPLERTLCYHLRLYWCKRAPQTTAQAMHKSHRIFFDAPHPKHFSQPPKIHRRYNVFDDVFIDHPVISIAPGLRPEQPEQVFQYRKCIGCTMVFGVCRLTCLLFGIVSPLCERGNFITTTRPATPSPFTPTFPTSSLMPQNFPSRCPVTQAGCIVRP